MKKELMEPFKIPLRFKDANDKIAFLEVEVTHRNKYPEFTICGEYDSGHGQCLDRINPQTKLQKELIAVWHTKHLQEITFEEYVAVLILVEQLKAESIPDANEDRSIEEMAENSLEGLWELIAEKGFSDPEKVIALALEENASLSDLDLITEEGGNRYSYGGREYLVCTDAEADDEHDADLDNYIDDCVLPELNKQYEKYFDRDAFKQDAQQDGRGHSLGRYDGNEIEQRVGKTDYYLYRQ